MKPITIIVILPLLLWLVSLLWRIVESCFEGFGEARRSFFFAYGYYRGRIHGETASWVKSSGLRRLFGAAGYAFRHFMMRYSDYRYKFKTSVASIFGLFVEAVYVLIFLIIFGLFLLIKTLIFCPLLPFALTADRLTGRIRRIHVRCTNCKISDEIQTLTPVFLCPKCNEKHERLGPSSNGVFSRKCRCGYRLATTNAGGRSKYEARCPHCDSKLLSTTSRQFGVQLIGTSGAGKTTYLAAFWQGYKVLLEKKRISYVASEEFDNLDKQFQMRTIQPTTDVNARAHCVIHRFGDVSIQVSFYDAAGRLFEQGGVDIQQLQFGYCEGFLFLLDPTSSPDNVSLATNIFINTFNAIRGRSWFLSKVPVALVIAKTDRIENKSASSTCDSECQMELLREFLETHGFRNTLNKLETTFSNVKIFSVCSNPNNGAWHSKRAVEPVLWLINQGCSPLYNRLK